MSKRKNHIIGNLWTSGVPNKNGDIFPTITVLAAQSNSAIIAIAEGIAEDLRNLFPNLIFTVLQSAVFQSIRGLTITEGDTVEANAATIRATIQQENKVAFEVRLSDRIRLVKPVLQARMAVDIVQGTFEYANPRTLECLYTACGEILAT